MSKMSTQSARTMDLYTLHVGSQSPCPQFGLLTPKTVCIVRARHLSGALEWEDLRKISFSTVSLGYFQRAYMVNTFRTKDRRSLLIINCILLFIVYAILIYLNKPWRPCGLIGKYILNSGCVRSFSQGEFATFTSDGSAIVHDNFTKVEIHSLRGWPLDLVAQFKQNDFVNFATGSSDGQWIAHQTWNEETGETVWIWNATTKSLERKHTLKPVIGNPIRDLVFSPDGKKLVIARAGSIEIWDITLWRKTELDGCWAIAFSSDGSKIALLDKKI